jgi:hypothetical protein
MMTLKEVYEKGYRDGFQKAISLASQEAGESVVGVNYDIKEAEKRDLLNLEYNLACYEIALRIRNIRFPDELIADPIFYDR